MFNLRVPICSNSTQLYWFKVLIVEKYKTVLNSIAPIPIQYSFSFEDDYEREQERNGWFDTRSR